MKSFERRLAKLEEKMEEVDLDFSLDASTIEELCKEGKVAQAVKLLWTYLEKQIAKYADDPDPIIQVVARSKLLRKLSNESLHQIVNYCKTARESWINALQQ
jgi:hypothetical protein